MKLAELALKLKKILSLGVIRTGPTTFKIFIS